MEKQKPEYFTIPVTKKHFGEMVHKMTADKLRDMLREKCRIRVRETRQNKFDVSRVFLENEKQWLTDVLKGELTELEMDLLLEGKILDEIIEEHYQWMVEEYDRSNDVEDVIQSKLVLCPICQLTELELRNHQLMCQCGFQQTFNGTLEEFWQTVQIKISAHEEKCVSKLTFFMDPNESALNVVCNQCDFLDQIE